MIPHGLWTPESETLHHMEILWYGHLLVKNLLLWIAWLQVTHTLQILQKTIVNSSKKHGIKAYHFRFLGLGLFFGHLGITPTVNKHST